MRIVYSDHAKKRIRQRGIEEWEIEHILKFPEYVKKSYNGTKEAVKEVKNRKLKVVYVELENYIKIITIRFV